MKRALGVAILMAGVLAQQSPVTANSVLPIEGDAPWGVLEKCAEDPPFAADADHDFAQVWAKQRECGEAAATVVSGGTDADRDRLWALFDALPEGSPMVDDVFDAFLDRDVERALAALSPAPATARVEPIVSTAEMPVFLRDAPPEMQQAWRLYESVAQSRQKIFERPTPDAAIAFQGQQPAFRRAVAAFLRGRISPAQTVEELPRYEWAGWCGFGSGLLYVPQAKALLIAYLQIGRVDLALAAGTALAGTVMGIEGPTTGADPRLLAAAGIDWERYHLGGVLSGRVDLALPLARQGSDGVARLLLAGVRLVAEAGDEAPGLDVESLFWPLAALVEPGEGAADPGVWSSAEVAPRPPDADAVAPDIQEGVLDLLGEHVGPSAGRHEAETASRVLVTRGRPESRPAFRDMLRSPYQEVRNRGAVGLRALGEALADPLPSRPVSFRFLVNGKPAAKRALLWTLEAADGGSETTSVHTDDTGVLSLERDGFVDPRHRASSLRFQSARLENTSDEWLNVAVEPPTDLDAITTISIRTGALTVLVPPSILDAAASEPTTLTLHAQGDGDGSDFDTYEVSGDMRVASDRIEFPRLQHGSYQVWLSVGAVLYRAPTVEVGAKSVTTTIGLDPAYSPALEEPPERIASPTNQPL